MTLVEKTKILLLSIFNLLFIGTFSYVFINATVFPNTFVETMNPWVVLIIAIVIGLILFGAYRLLRQLSKKSLIIISCLNFLIFLALQLFFFKYFQLTPTWDVGVIYREALNHKDYIGELSSYFTVRYPNNIPLLLAEIYGVRILDFLGIDNYYKVFTFLNIVLVLCSMGGLYWFSYRRVGIIGATWGSFLMLFITPLYMYTPIFYTDTLVMPFVIFGVLLYDIFYQSTHKFRYLWVILMSILLTIGVLFKANVIILVIAIFIHYVMTRNYKQWLSFIGIFIVPFMLINFVYQQLVTPLYPVEKSELGFPATHWIMMGTYGNGSYYEEDVQFTESLKVDQKLSNEEIEKVHLEVIKERLMGDGVQGFIKHINRKLNFTWAEGTYFAVPLLNRQPVDDNMFRDYVYGEARKPYIYFCQAVQLNIIGMLVVAGFKLFKRKSVFEIVLSLTVFGTFLFLLIWETRSRYLVLILPVMMALCTYAMCDKNNELKG